MFLFGAALLVPGASAQTLAHRGWIGSGLNVAPWWQTAIFYQLDPKSLAETADSGKSAFAAVTDRVDYLKSLDVDALVLTPFDLQPTQPSQAGAMTAASSEQDDFDSLLHEAGRRQLRILVDLPISGQTPATTLALARFWLGRGVAGLRLSLTKEQAHTNNLSPAEIVALVRDLRAACAAYSGDRVLLWDSDQPFASVRSAAQSDRADSVAETSIRHQPGRSHTRAKRAPQARSPLAGRNPIGPHLEVDHALERLPALNATELRATMLSEQAPQARGEALPVWVTDSTNSVRSWTRYSQEAGTPAPADAGQALARASVLAAVLLTSRALPMLVSGQEIGSPQPGADEESKTQSTEENPVEQEPQHATSFAEISPESATQAPGGESLVNFYRKLSALRHVNPTLQHGSFHLLATAQPEIVSWVRVPEGKGSRQPALVVVCNLSKQIQLASLLPGLQDAGIQIEAGSSLETLASSHSESAGRSGTNPSAAIVALAPYGIWIGQVRSHVRLRNPAPRRHPTRHRRRTR